MTDWPSVTTTGKKPFFPLRQMTSDLEQKQSAFWRRILFFLTEALSVVLTKIGKNIKTFKRRHFCTFFNEQRIKQT